MNRHLTWLALAAIGLSLGSPSLLHAQGGAQPAAAAFDGHMHAGRIDFPGPDQVKAVWTGWSNGKPSAHSPPFNLSAKKA